MQNVKLIALIGVLLIVLMTGCVKNPALDCSDSKKYNALWQEAEDDLASCVKNCN